MSVADILVQPGAEAAVEGEVDIAETPLPAGARATGLAAFKAVVANVGEGFLVRGEGEYPAEMPCSRCAEEFAKRVAFAFDEMYVPEEASEEDEQDDDVFTFEGGEIDIGPAIVQAAVLALPIRPLCAEGCAGLCPRCGRNLNQGPCGCPAPETDERWAKLKDLAHTDKKEV